MRARFTVLVLVGCGCLVIFFWSPQDPATLKDNRGAPGGGPMALAVGEANRSSPTAEPMGHPKPEHPHQWAHFRSVQRLSEDGTIPHNAVMNAVRQRNGLLTVREHGRQDRSLTVAPLKEVRRQAGKPVSPAGEGGIGPNAWRCLGPGNVGGRSRAIVIHPDEPDRMWLGSVSGGLWKSDDAGQRWDVVDDFLPNLAITAMVMDPKKPKIMYIGTGEGAFFLNAEGSSNTAAMRGAGVFKSKNGGKTWKQLESTAGPEWYHVCRLAIHAKNRKTILAATGSGIYRSTDGGKSWSQRTTGATLDVKFHPVNKNLAVAGRADNLAQYSTDGGVTWSNATGIFSGNRVELAYARSNPEWIYASVSGRNWRIRVWRSTDGGKTYSLRTQGSGFTTLANYDNALWVDPTNANRVIVGGLDLYRSTNGAVNFTKISRWSSAPTSAHADHHIIVEHPQFDGDDNKIVFFGNDGGIYRADDVYTVSENRGWQELNNNLGITQFYGAAVNVDSGKVLGGTQDNGTLLFTGDTENWRTVIGGDGTFCAADATDPLFLYGSTQRLYIRRSRNGGGSFSSITSGPNPLEDRGTLKTNFIPYYMLDPNEPNRMLAAAVRLWRSNNVKANVPDWFVIKPKMDDCPLVPGEPERADHFGENDPCNISTMAVAPGDSDVIWVGHNRGDLYMTRSGTQQEPDWVRVHPNEPNLPKRWVSRIAIDANDHRRVYVAFLGYEPNNVWRTTDGGNSWEPITGQGKAKLPEAPATSILVHPINAGWLYVGTDVGVFASTDDGLTWSTTNDGPATVGVDELLWQDECTILAVTHGRGVFEADLCGPCGDIDALKVTCKPGSFTVKARLSSGLEPGTELTLTLDDAHSQKVTVKGNGKAKAKWTEVEGGDHEVCVDECPGLCNGATCG